MDRLVINFTRNVFDTQFLSTKRRHVRSSFETSIIV